MLCFMYMCLTCVDVCQHGDIRLLDELSGEVKVCLDGVWTSLCGDEWSSVEASVACRQLGYAQGMLT